MPGSFIEAARTAVLRKRNGSFANSQAVLAEQVARSATYSCPPGRSDLSFKRPGHFTSTALTRFIALRSLPKRNHERKIPPFCKAGVAAKKKFFADFLSRKSESLETPGKKAPEPSGSGTFLCLSSLHLNNLQLHPVAVRVGEKARVHREPAVPGRGLHRLGAPLQGRPPPGVHLGPVLAVEGQAHPLVPAQGPGGRRRTGKSPNSPGPCRRSLRRRAAPWQAPAPAPGCRTAGSPPNFAPVKIPRCLSVSWDASFRSRPWGALLFWQGMPRLSSYCFPKGPGKCSLHGKIPGYRQRETTSAKFPHFAKPVPLPKKNHEHKIPPFCKAQVAAKKKSLANASPLRDGKPAVHAGQARDERPAT